MKMMTITALSLLLASSSAFASNGNQAGYVRIAPISKTSYSVVHCSGSPAAVTNDCHALATLSRDELQVVRRRLNLEVTKHSTYIGLGALGGIFTGVAAGVLILTTAPLSIPMVISAFVVSVVAGLGGGALGAAGTKKAIGNEKIQTAQMSEQQAAALIESSENIIITDDHPFAQKLKSVLRKQ